MLGLVKLDQGIDLQDEQALDEFLQALAHLIPEGGCEEIIGHHFGARLEAMVAGLNPADGAAMPQNFASTRQLELGIGAGGQDSCPCGNFSDQSLDGGGLEKPCITSGKSSGGREREAGNASDFLAFDGDHSAFVYTRHQTFLLRQAPHQYTGFAVDETFRQLVVKGIRQAVFDFPGAALPIEGGFQPVRAVGNEGPGADVGNALRERIDVAFGVFTIGQLARQPVLGNGAGLSEQESQNPGDKVGVLGG